MSNNKKRNIIIGSLCAVVLLMAVGYAAFQTVLNIQGTSNITSSWNVKITKVESKNVVGTASNNGDPSFEELSATFKTTNYLFSTDYPWTISPDAENSFLVFRVDSYGCVNNDRMLDVETAIWPVLYLKSDITLSGEGTTSNPYKIA